MPASTHALMGIHMCRWRSVRAGQLVLVSAARCHSFPCGRRLLHRRREVFSLHSDSVLTPTLQAVTGTRAATAEESAPADAEPLRRARHSCLQQARFAATQHRQVASSRIKISFSHPPLNCLAGSPSRRLSTATSRLLTSRTGRCATRERSHLLPVRQTTHSASSLTWLRSCPPSVRRVWQEGWRRRGAHSVHLQLPVQFEELLARARRSPRLETNYHHQSRAPTSPHCRRS